MTGPDPNDDSGPDDRPGDRDERLADWDERLVDRIADDGVEDVAQLLERPVSLPDGLFPLPPLSTPRTPDGRPERPADGVSDDAASLYEELESVRTAKAELVSAELATPRPPSSAAVTGSASPSSSSRSSCGPGSR